MGNHARVIRVLHTRSVSICELTACCNLLRVWLSVALHPDIALSIVESVSEIIELKG